MSATVLVCGSVFDGVREDLGGPCEILVEEGWITDIARSVHRPDDADVVDLSGRVVSPGFIDCHVPI